MQKADGDPGTQGAVGKQYPESLLGSPLGFGELASHLENRQGVYEISLYSPIRYPNGYSHIVYVGESSQLRKRFQSYLAGRAHTDALNSLMKHPDRLSVRVAYTVEHKSLESRMIHSFESQFGAIPQYNLRRPS